MKKLFVIYLLFLSTAVAAQTCPVSNTFTNGDGGGTHTYTYNDVESMSIDFESIDNSFQLTINGVTLHVNPLELLAANLTTGETHLKFADNSNVPESWLHEVSESWVSSYVNLPRLRIIIDENGLVELFGTRETTTGVLEIITTADSSSFNTFSFPTGPTSVTITNFDETGSDGMEGTITVNESCSTAGIWAENGTTMYYSAGKVAVNTDDLPSGYLFGVNGKMIAEELKVQVFPWSDFVFEKNYALPSLLEVEKHINEKGHLKDIPNAEEVAKNGILLGQMDAKLLQKIEELMLYTIDQEKKIKALQMLKSENESLVERLNRLEAILLKK